MRAARLLALGWVCLVLVEALVGTVYAALGYGLIRAMEVLGRRHATLERA